MVQVEKWFSLHNRCQGLTEVHKSEKSRDHTGLIVN